MPMLKAWHAMGAMALLVGSGTAAPAPTGLRGLPHLILSPPQKEAVTQQPKGTKESTAAAPSSRPVFRFGSGADPQPSSRHPSLSRAQSLISILTLGGILSHVLLM